MKFLTTTSDLSVYNEVNIEMHLYLKSTLIPWFLFRLMKIDFRFCILVTTRATHHPGSFSKKIVHRSRIWNLLHFHPSTLWCVVLRYVVCEDESALQFFRCNKAPIRDFSITATCQNDILNVNILNVHSIETSTYL